jgi:ProP effector
MKTRTPGRRTRAACRAKLNDDSPRLARTSRPDKPPTSDQLKALVRARWPEAFSDPPKPLAIGIDRAIARELGLGSARRKRLRGFFRRWCNHDRYLEAVAAPGAMRVGLDGNPVGLDGNPVEPVSPEHAEHARERLEERRQRRAQQEPQGGNHAKPVLRLRRPA